MVVGSRADADELYTDQEKALSDYLKLHPMLSLEATSHRTLQLVGDLVEQSSVPTRELEDIVVASPRKGAPAKHKHSAV